VPAAAAGDDDLRLLREIDHIYEAIKVGGHVRAKNGVRTPPPRHHHQQQQQQQLNGTRQRSALGTSASCGPGAQFTKYLTIYRKIIVSLS